MALKLLPLPRNLQPHLTPSTHDTKTPKHQLRRNHQLRPWSNRLNDTTVRHALHRSRRQHLTTRHLRSFDPRVSPLSRPVANPSKLLRLTTGRYGVATTVKLASYYHRKPIYTTRKPGRYIQLEPHHHDQRRQFQPHHQTSSGGEQPDTTICAGARSKQPIPSLDHRLRSISLRRPNPRDVARLERSTAEHLATSARKDAGRNAQDSQRWSPQGTEEKARTSSSYLPCSNGTNDRASTARFHGGG